MSQLKTIRIDIVSDVMCPWCIVGYKRLEQAIASVKQQANVEIHWQPFELNPNMPPEGQNLGEHLAEKYGSTPEQSAANRENLVRIGQSLDFEFNFSSDSRIYNTFQAHQLLCWAGEQGLQHQLKLALFTAYFTNQQDPSDVKNLINIAASVGLDKQQAETVLTSNKYANDIREQQQFWQSHGVQAVPAVILAQKYLISGAQETASFAQALQQVIDETE